MGTEILVFEVEGQHFGVRSADVVQVLRAATLSPLPLSPETIEGVMKTLVNEITGGSLRLTQ